jgi:voltage-gated sodium channel
LGAVVGIISVILYVFSVMATKLFGERFPEWFGTLGESAYTLFQIMTLESWSMGIARPVMEAFPYAWLFFVVYILISTFTMLNLFIAVVVNAMQREQAAESESGVAEDVRALRMEIAALRADLSCLQAAGVLPRERPSEDRMTGKSSEQRG